MNPTIDQTEEHINQILQEFSEKEKMMADRLWLDGLVSKFDEVLRLNYTKDIDEFTSEVLTQLAESSNAFRGVFYILDKEENVIKAISGYACILESMSQTTFKLGEGLVGQCIHSKKTLFFDKVQLNNLQVQTSNLSISAACMLYLPLVFNETVFGAIELMYFNTLENKFIQAFEIISRNTASTVESINNAKINAQLLLASQQQSEELRAQEEELRQNLEELQATQEQIRQRNVEMESRMEATNNSAIGSIEFDLDSTILDANESFLKIFGYTKGEIVGKKHRMFVEEKHASSEEYISMWENLSNGIAQTGEYHRFGKDGKEVYLMGAYSIIRDAHGNPSKILKLATDITNTKQILTQSQQQSEELRAQEEELRQNLEELQATQEQIRLRGIEIENRMEATNNSAIGSIEFDLDSTILDANESFLKIFGYTKVEIVGKKHKMFVEEKYASSEEYISMWENLRNGIAQTGECHRFGKDGKEVYLMGAYSIIRDAHGNPGKILKLATDVTHTKQLLIQSQQQSEELRAQEEELRQNLEELQVTQEQIRQRSVEMESRMEAINNSSIASIEFDLDSTILDANESFLKIFGYKKEDIVGKKHRMFVEEKYSFSLEYASFWENLRNGIVQTGEYHRFGKDSKEIYLMGAYSIIKDVNGNPTKILKLATDITNTKQFFAQRKEGIFNNKSYFSSLFSSLKSIFPNI